MQIIRADSYNALLCASMCSANANCESYYYETSHCYESASSSLIGSIPNLTTSKDIYIDEDIYSNNRSNCGEIFLKTKKSYKESFVGNGQWIWGPWSTCSKTCGLGTQTRSAITCNGTKYAGMPCSGNGTEVTTCQGRSVLGEFNFVSVYINMILLL